MAARLASNCPHVGSLTGPAPVSTRMRREPVSTRKPPSWHGSVPSSLRNCRCGSHSSSVRSYIGPGGSRQHPSCTGVTSMSPTRMDRRLLRYGWGMASVGRFGAVACAMVTPFTADGALDLDGAVRLARWLTDHGVDGLVIAGTTGESPVLSDDEKVDLWRAVRESVTVPVLAGSTTNDTAHSIELTRKATDAGV